MDTFDMAIEECDPAAAIGLVACAVNLNGEVILSRVVAFDAANPPVSATLKVLLRLLKDKVK